MIKVLIEKSSAGIKLIEISGHAESGEYGKDLVCAGVSACYCGAVKALRNEKKNISETHREGYAKVEAEGEISLHDQLVLEVLSEQIACLGDSYPQFIRIDKSN
jgi:uncharacterized protein YsxB (DUF464 family)